MCDDISDFMRSPCILMKGLRPGTPRGTGIDRKSVSGMGCNRNRRVLEVNVCDAWPGLTGRRETSSVVVDSVTQKPQHDEKGDP